MYVAFVGIPSTRHINRKYLLLKWFQSIDEVSIRLPDLSSKGKSKDGIDYQCFREEMLCKFLADLSVLASEMLWSVEGDVIQLAQLQVVAIFALQSFESYEVYWVLHHFQVPGSNQTITSVVAWPYQHRNRLILLSNLTVMSLFAQNGMRDLGSCQPCKFHKRFGGKMMLVHECLIEQFIKFASGKGNLPHAIIKLLAEPI